MSYKLVETTKWKEISDKLPLVAFTGLVGENMTIYACLQQAIKIFDHIIVFGDGPTKDALEMLDKFLIDHSSMKDKIQYIDQTNIDPWPWIGFLKTELDWKDKLNNKNNVNDIMVKSWSKAAAKKYNVARALFPNGMLFSLHSDVILFNDSRDRFKERIRNISNPFFDSEWFSMNTCLDLDNIISICSADSSAGNLKCHPDLAQRRVYDYPGDWGLMCLYGSSLLSIGPDPVGPEAECLYPWQQVTQCQKKGHDINVPYAIHLEFWRESMHEKSFKYIDWKLVNIESLQETDTILYQKYKDLDIKNNLFFPKKLILDLNHKALIQGL